MSEQITTLAGGLTVVSERLDHVRSVAVGWFVGAGSRDEEPAQAGVAHLLEHMLFRGTASYGSAEIDERFDALGGEVNAATGKETTSVYARVLDQHLDEAFAIGSELVWRPRLEESDLEQEREIVLEELAMYEDEPGEQVFDLLATAVFGDTPLGRPVIGTRDSVGGMSIADLRAFHRSHYGSGVVAAAGAVDHERLVELVDGARNGVADQRDPGASVRPAQPATDRAERVLVKQTEQTHLCLGGPAIARDDERRFALRVLDMVLGGCASSRLFQEIRERRGLAYSVSSFVSLMAGTGEVGVYVGTRHDNVETVLEVLADELARLREEPVPAAELDRARESVKGRTVLALESTGARMNRLGGALIAGMPILTIDELLGRLDAVGADDLQSLACELLDPERLSLAAIGPDGLAERLPRGVLTVAPAAAARDKPRRARRPEQGTMT